MLLFNATPLSDVVQLWSPLSPPRSLLAAMLIRWSMTRFKVPPCLLAQGLIFRVRLRC